MALQTQRFSGRMSQHVRRLGVYFDTVLVVDQLHIPGDENREAYISSKSYLAKMELTSRLAYFLRMRSLVSSNIDRPIFSLVPDVFAQSADEVAQLTIRYLDETILHLGLETAEEFRRALSRDENRIAVLTDDSEEAKNLQKLFTLEDLKNVWVTRDGRTISAIGQQKIADMRGLDLFRQLFRNVYETLYSLRETHAGSLAVNADPVFYYGNEKLFTWLQGQQAADARANLGQAQEERTAARALLSDDMQFLEALTLSQLARIREEGRLEDLRETLRLSRSEYLSLRHEDLDTAAQIFSNNMITTIEEAHERVKTNQQSRRRNLAFSGLSFLAAGGMAFLSLAFPASAILSYLGAGAGGILGGKSVLDIHRESRAHADVSRNEVVSPLAVLYRAKMKQGGESSSTT